jgi:DNA-binding MarR family transcriptional regulator
MQQFIDSCTRIARQIDGVVILVHHTNKSGNTERGSSVLRASADVMIRLTLLDDETQIEFDKVKDSQPAPMRSIRLLPVTLPNGEQSCVAVLSSKVVISDKDRLSNVQYKVLDILAMEISANGITQEDIAAQIGVSRGSVIKALDALKKRGYIQYQDNFKDAPLQVTPKGRTALEHYRKQSDDPPEPPDLPNIPSDPNDPYDPSDRGGSNALSLQFEPSDQGDQWDQEDQADQRAHLTETGDQLALIPPRTVYP